MAKHETADRTVHYDGPAGGWGSLKGITKIFGSEWATPAAIETLARQNKPHGVERRVDGLKVAPFALPDGCLGGYYPELNPLIPLWSRDQKSKTPASKSVPVRIGV